MPGVHRFDPVESVGGLIERRTAARVRAEPAAFVAPDRVRTRASAF
jgi:hypothetical protein